MLSDASPDTKVGTRAGKNAARRRSHAKAELPITGGSTDSSAYLPVRRGHRAHGRRPEPRAGNDAGTQRDLFLHQANEAGAGEGEQLPGGVDQAPVVLINEDTVAGIVTMVIASSSVVNHVNDLKPASDGSHPDDPVLPLVIDTKSHHAASGITAVTGVNGSSLHVVVAGPVGFCAPAGDGRVDHDDRDPSRDNLDNGERGVVTDLKPELPTRAFKDAVMLAPQPPTIATGSPIVTVPAPLDQPRMRGAVADPLRSPEIDIPVSSEGESEGYRGTEVYPDGKSAKQKGSGEISKETFPMDDVDKITVLIHVARRGASDPLRKTRKLLLATDLTLVEVAAMTVEKLTSELSQHVVSRSGEPVKNPRAKARRILAVLRQESLEHPEIGIAVPPPLPKRVELVELPFLAWPAMSRADVAAWEAFNGDNSIRQERGLTKLRAKTLKRYKKHVAQLLHIAKDDLKIVVDDTFGIRSLTEECVVVAMLEILEGFLSSWTIAGFVSALLRAARDLLGHDPEHKSHIEFLEGELVRRIPNVELTAQEILDLDNLAEDDVFSASLRNAPDAIAERSRNPTIGAVASLIRLATALAWEIKLSIPFLNATDLATLHQDRMRVSDGMFYLLVRDLKHADGESWEACSPLAARLFANWDASRQTAGRPSGWLFPAPRRCGEAGEVVYQAEAQVADFMMNEMEVVMGARLAFRELKKFVTHKAVMNHPGEIPAIAQATGVKHHHNLERRFRPVIQRARVLAKKG